MKKNIQKLSRWLRSNALNFIAAFLFIPAALSILSCFVQGFYFALTGDWLLPHEQIIVGLITSLALAFGGYRLYVYLKLLNDAR